MNSKMFPGHCSATVCLVKNGVGTANVACCLWFHELELWAAVTTRI